MIKKVFIDGEEGTTGLHIYERLEKHPEIKVIKINSNKRKDVSEKKEMMTKADLVFLCLPDEASRETVALGKQLKENCPIFIDASTAHRTSKMWSYGLPELSDKFRNNIKKSKLISVAVITPGWDGKKEKVIFLYEKSCFSWTLFSKNV